MKFARFAFVWIVVTGCLNKPDCIPTATNLVKISFVNASNQARPTAVDSIRVAGLNEVLYQAVTVSAVELPLRPDLTQAEFEFFFEQRDEKIALVYDAQPQVISMECGAYTIFKDLTLTESTFVADSVITTQTSTNATVNIQLRIE